MNRSFKDESGQSVVEFAIAMPVLAFVLFALVEFGFMLNNQVAIVNASRDGARIAVLQSSQSTQTADVQAAVTQAEQPLVGCTPVSGTPIITSGTNSLGGSQPATWSVQVSCTYAPITPLGSLVNLVTNGGGGSSPLNNSGFTISGKTVMRDTSCNRPSCSP